MGGNPLTQQEMDRCRYHTGYPQVATAASLQFGLPKPLQLAFLLEIAMTQLLPLAVPRVRAILQTLDNIEQQIINAQPFLTADVLEELYLAGSKDPRGRLVTDRLESEYVRWAKRLADVFGVPLYPFSERFKRTKNNVPIRG